MASNSKYNSTRWWRKQSLAIVLLAVLCIGGAELLVCRFADPQLYQQITAPFHALGDELSQWMGQLTLGQPQPEDASLVNQAQTAHPPATESPQTLADPGVTWVKEVGQQQLLTGGSMEIVFFQQSDSVWAEEPYGTDQIGGYGCGPTALAMAVSSMTDTAMDPAAMAQWAVANGHWVKGRGSRLSIVGGAADAFGLSAQSISPATPEDLRQELSMGSILVALMGPGHFTDGGHFILLRGATLDGGILVADPNSLDRSLTVWDPQLILDELSSPQSSGGPIWRLTGRKPQG